MASIEQIYLHVVESGSFKKAAEHLSVDGGGHLTYLAPTRVNLSLMEERWPDLEFRSTREH